ncbi:1140_t:CDS:2, partial [Scutellospora calospora]
EFKNSNKSLDTNIAIGFNTNIIESFNTNTSKNFNTNTSKSLNINIISININGLLQSNKQLALTETLNNNSLKF